MIDSKKKIYHLVQKGEEFIAEADATKDLPNTIDVKDLEQDWNSAQVLKSCIVFDGKIHSTQVEGLTESVKPLQSYLVHKKESLECKDSHELEDLVENKRM